MVGGRVRIFAGEIVFALVLANSKSANGRPMVELSPQHQQFVDAQVSAGLFQKPAEVVGAALDLLRQRQGEYDQLRIAIEQVERGEYQPFDPDDVKRRGRERQAPRQ